MNPIRFESDYEIERNRLTVFFRAIIAIPWLIWASLYGIAAFVVVIVAWFAMLFTARFPEGMYSFVASYVRLSARVTAYLLLLTDELPSGSRREHAGAGRLAVADDPDLVGLAGRQIRQALRHEEGSPRGRLDERGRRLGRWPAAS